MYSDISLEVPNKPIRLRPGQKVRLGRFNTTMWVVGYGWYSWAGNRPVCGWYLQNAMDLSCIKPLQKPDLDDIYLIQS